MTKVVSLNPPNTYNSHSLVNSDGKLFFIARDGINGQEIYVSDGTAAGTHIVTDFETASSTIAAGSSLTPFKNGILFKRGNQLWFTDGTPDSVFLVKEFAPLISGTALHLYNSFLVDSILYFIAETSSHGNELWRTDGTEDGTVMLTDICAGPCGSDIYHFVKLDDYRIMFTATDALGGNEPWIYQFDTPPPVGVNSIAGNTENQLKIFPNPIQNHEVLLEWDKNLEPKNIQLIDINGRVILNEVV